MATDTHSECVTFIAFPRQQWLRERASVLRLYVRILPVLFPLCTAITSPYINRRLAFLIKSQRALCEVRNESVHIM
jgi:hypothetical protein